MQASLFNSGVGEKTAYRDMMHQARGIENVNFLEQDVQNKQSLRKSLIDVGGIFA